MTAALCITAVWGGAIALLARIWAVGKRRDRAQAALAERPKSTR